MPFGAVESVGSVAKHGQLRVDADREAAWSRRWGSDVVNVVSRLSPGSSGITRERPKTGGVYGCVAGRGGGGGRFAPPGI